jgi:hypothetical protein
MLNLNVPVQASLFKEHASPGRRRVVNVASVKQRGPFRYPGGKTWLVPEVIIGVFHPPDKLSPSNKQGKPCTCFEGRN